MHSRNYLVPAVALALVLITAVLIAGCTSYSSPPTPAATATTSSSGPLTPGTSVPAGTSPAVSTTVVSPVTTVSASNVAAVTIKNLEFTPSSLTIKPGTTVTWTNVDDVAHTVTSLEASPVVFKSGTLQKGDTFLFTFTQAGTYPYECSIHTFMKATVVVAS